MANFTVRPPGGTLHKRAAFGQLNELLKPLEFSILALNGWQVTVVGTGFRQEAIRAIYGYFAKRELINNDETLQQPNP